MLRNAYLCIAIVFSGLTGAAQATEPPEGTGIRSAMECINVKKSIQDYLPTEVTNTCDVPVAFSNWFCGTEEAPCSSYQHNRWSEEPAEYDLRGGIYILCPGGDSSWRERGYQCLPVLRFWRTGKYAYGACHFSEERLLHWQNDIDVNRTAEDWISGDRYYWNDACERWLAKRSRDIADTHESPVEEEYYFDLGPPSMYSL